MGITRIAQWIKRALIKICIAPIRVYQRWISPLLPRSCRYYPSCSQYAIEAIQTHGPIVGMAMGVWRILRCNPWSLGGYDPVPPKRE